MNKRIRELAQQAQVGSAEFDNGINYFVSTEETFNKFAELIVKECLTFCEYRGDRFDEYDSGMTERARIIRESIQEHFGVTE